MSSGLEDRFQTLHEIVRAAKNRLPAGEWDYLVDYCERSRIAFIPWFPLASGKVAGAVLDRIAKAHQRTAKQAALAWLLKRSPVMLPIPGTSSLKHLEENVEAAALRLSDQEYQQLAQVPEFAA